MARSNLIPITRIYDIYPKYTYSDDVKKFMDEIVDIDRANVYSKEEVIAMFTKLKSEIDKQCKVPNNNASSYDWNNGVYACYKAVQQKIEQLKGENNG